MRTDRPPLPTCALALALLGAPLAAQEPALSEFQAANSGTLLDEDGDSSDWIEIHNPLPAPADVGGWFLTDDANDLTRWAIPPATVIPARSFLIVFASGKDRTTVPLHTDFKLKAEGEYLALVRPNGSVATEYAPEYPPQVADTSFGIPDPPGPPSYFVVPTPRAANGPGGPLVLAVEHAPASPLPGQDVVVGAEVPHLDPAGAVTLVWRLDFDAEQSLAMNDDGAGADPIAGDGVYSALLPGAAFGPGDMLRWKVTAQDSSGSTTRPLFPDPAGSPEYFGSLVQDPSIASPLPVWWLWTEDPDQAQRPEGARGSIYFEGAFHDNVFVRRRGSSTVKFPKTSLKFDFNPSHRFDHGAGPPADEVNVDTTYNDKAYLRVPLAYEVYRLAGCVAPQSFALRVQLNGEFFGVSHFVEEPGEESFLERKGLDPAGALYKMFSVADKWHYPFAQKKTRLHESHTDLKQFLQALQSDGFEEVVLFDSVDVPACINYLAATSLLHGNDQIGKNYYLYRDTEGDGEWRLLPWDPDMSLGQRWKKGDTLTADVDPFSHPFFGDEAHPKANGKWNRLIDDLYTVPRVREMYLRRLRSLMDRILTPPGTPESERYLEARLAQEYVRLLPDVELDRMRWGLPAWGRPHGMRLAIERIRDEYLVPRREHLFVTHGPPTGLIPPANPHPVIEIDWIEGDPASGDPAEEYVRLRNPGDLAADLTGWRLGGAVAFTFEPGTVLEAGGVLFSSPAPAAFRSRPTPPTGGQGLLVVGPWSGSIESGEWVRLYDPHGQLVDEAQY